MGFASQTTVLKRGDGAATEVFTAVGEVVSINGPDGAAPEIDVTHLLSTRHEIVMGLPDEGRITLEGNFVGSDAQQQGLHADRNAQTLRNFELEFSDQPAGGSNDTKFAFSAYVLSFSVQAQTDGKLAFSVILRVTGEVTVTWAS